MKNKIIVKFVMVLLIFLLLFLLLFLLKIEKVTKFDDLNQNQTVEQIVNKFKNTNSNKGLVVIIYKNSCPDCKKIEKAVVNEINQNKENYYIGINAENGIKDDIKNIFPEKIFEKNGKIFVPTIVKFKNKDKELIKLSKSVEGTIEQSITTIRE